MSRPASAEVSVVLILLVLSWMGAAHAAPLSWSSLTIDTDVGDISANGVNLIFSADCLFSDVPPSVGGYANVAKFTLHASYLTGYDGISIDAAPTLSGSRAVALVVPGDITINAAWNQIGGNATITYTEGVPTFGAAGVCGGFNGGDAQWYYTGNRGEGPGGGGTGGSQRWSGSGGSLVSYGGVGGGSEGVFRAPEFDALPPPQPGKSAETSSDLWGGSGGGGNNPVSGGQMAGGGGGGGAVGFFSSADTGSIHVTAAGSVTVDGGLAEGGRYGSGGGGSGGTIILSSGYRGAVTVEGALSADGGAGGVHYGGEQPGLRSGGGGAGGEIAVYHGMGLTESVTPTVAGGVDPNDPQPKPGSPGHYYVERLPIPGDANLDEVVDTQDFSTLKGHFGLDPAEWGDGNFNEDTVVDTQDFSILKGHFGETRAAPAGSAPAPEPASAGLLLVALAALIVRRRKR